MECATQQHGHWLQFHKCWCTVVYVHIHHGCFSGNACEVARAKARKASWRRCHLRPKSYSIVTDTFTGSFPGNGQNNITFPAKDI